MHFIEDARFAHLLPAGCAPISDAEAHPPPTAEEIAAQAAAEAIRVADAEAKAIAKADNVVKFLCNHTPAEVEAYVQAQVTDLPSARALLKRFGVALCVLAKQSLR